MVVSNFKDILSNTLSQNESAILSYGHTASETEVLNKVSCLLTKIEKWLESFVKLQYIFILRLMYLQ